MDSRQRGNDLVQRFPKYPWEPYSGCNFTVEVYVCAKGSPIVETEGNHSNSRSFFEPGTNEIDKILLRNSVVAEKIRNIDLEQIINDQSNGYDDIEYLKVCHEGSIMFLHQYSNRESVERWVNTELLYLDEVDVEYWSVFLEKVMKRNIQSLIQNYEIA